MALSPSDRFRYWKLHHWMRVALVCQSAMLKRIPPKRNDSEAWTELRRLDMCRRELHRAYQDLFKRTAFFCRRCRGACCKGAEDRFSPLDHLFMGIDPRQNSSPLYRLKHRLRLPGLFRNAIKLLSPGECKHLGPCGCLLPPEERPMFCVESVCRSLYYLLDPPEKRKLNRLHRESCKIRRAAFKLQLISRVY